MDNFKYYEDDFFNIKSYKQFENILSLFESERLVSIKSKNMFFIFLKELDKLSNIYLYEIDIKKLKINGFYEITMKSNNNKTIYQFVVSYDFENENYKKKQVEFDYMFNYFIKLLRFFFKIML